MLSQRFGFSITTQLSYEAEFACPLPQARGITLQFAQKLAAMPHNMNEHFGRSLNEYVLSMESWFNDWDPEATHIVRQIDYEFGPINDSLRMELLREALSWRWLKLQEEAIMGQFYLCAMVDDRTYLTLGVGWNAGADPEAVAGTRECIRLYFRQFEKMGIEYERRTLYPPEPAAAENPPPRSYGPRLDTLEKLTRLRRLRQKACRRQQVGLTRMEACEQAGITPATVKKYDRLLYDRWYDAAYMGES